ncbi:hypothetical protein C4J81_09040 [Deltaproteobacteria bacterium Smac51]|nr:hypothetical protein C4J81_09040 [Deltaproteobacteria bacterium Smac51]
MKKFWTIASISCGVLMGLLWGVVFLFFPKGSPGHSTMGLTAIFLPCALFYIASMTHMFMVFSRFGLMAFTGEAWERGVSRTGPYLPAVGGTTFFLIWLVWRLSGSQMLCAFVGGTFPALSIFIVPSAIRLRHQSLCHCPSPTSDWIGVILGLVIIIASIAFGLFYF